METTADKPEGPAFVPSQPEPPVRVLVQTLTHLVPGSGSYERTFFILNLLCQHHWGCDFESPRFRWGSYDDQFAFNNRRCYFLIDHGESENDDEVPILSYEWTGESLKPLPQLAKDPEIRTVLKNEAPFTPKPRERREKPPIRKTVKMRLYCEDHIPPHEFDHMRAHPEDREWLKAHIRPRLWRKFVADCNTFRTPEIPEISE